MSEEKEKTELEKRKEYFGFDIQENAKDKDIIIFKFNDGREYKLQKPSFFEIHSVLTGPDVETNLFKLALKNLFPENEKSPKIDEDYLNKNRQEALYLWSTVLRGSLYP